MGWLTCASACVTVFHTIVGAPNSVSNEHSFSDRIVSGPNCTLDNRGGGGLSLLTERYRWSFRPLTSHISLCVFVLTAHRAHVH